ncbi:ADP-glyceromanno-heptose 6-epimerase [Alphaproteobacteria bacterium]|nr:ADP-glyceromanno-heptose 6-epimerase [Alphaproteobacteria bacterium]
MILITGGAGFIGSNLANELIEKGYEVVICDYKNKIKKKYFNDFNSISNIIEPEDLDNFIIHNNIVTLFHLGAVSSTTHPDGNAIWLNNIFLSYKIWKLCSLKKIKLVYASSASTYGNGELGFIDNINIEYLNSLTPLNVYAWTKNEVDKRNIFSDKILNICPSQWIGLKFFNVYGPNEEHKDNMISIILKTYKQICNSETTNLFKSYNIDFKDGEQKRDFIYVKDCVKVLIWFMEHSNKSGLFNVGTGEARTFNTLVSNVYKSMNKNININYIDMPKNIKNQYQYITKADLGNLRSIGYTFPFTSLEEGIKDYINNHLIN